MQANPGKFKEVDMKLEALGRKPVEQKSVGPLDIDLMLKRLGRRSNKRYIWDTIWECDENLDGRIDWEEMKLCFQRNASDETGLEHSKFYNLIQVRGVDVPRKCPAHLARPPSTCRMPRRCSVNPANPANPADPANPANPTNPPLLFQVHDV